MDPATRTAVLLVGLIFVLFFGGMTLVVIAEHGFFTLWMIPSIAIVSLLGIAIWGAINNPPDDRR